MKCPKCNYDSPVPDPGTAFTVEEYCDFMKFMNYKEEFIASVKRELNDPEHGIAAHGLPAPEEIERIRKQISKSGTTFTTEETKRWLKAVARPQRRHTATKRGGE